ncbi:biopolymer transporter ExbD [candidate division WOR-3 bacterium]|nr:biopolymer transporter ExbD [candidate division WOR-3 bacterium]
MKVNKAVMNMSPLSDIAFTILMTLMVTVPIMAISGKIKVDLPEAHTVEQRVEDNTSITITPTGQMAICDIDTTFEGVIEILKEKIKEDPEKMVLIRADKYVRHGIVLDLLRTAKILGAKHVAIATSQKGQEKEEE